MTENEEGVDSSAIYGAPSEWNNRMASPKDPEAVWNQSNPMDSWVGILSIWRWGRGLEGGERGGERGGVSSIWKWRALISIGRHWWLLLLLSRDAEPAPVIGVWPLLPSRRSCLGHRCHWNDSHSTSDPLQSPLTFDHTWTQCRLHIIPLSTLSFQREKNRETKPERKTIYIYQWSFHMGTTSIHFFWPTHFIWLLLMRLR